MKKQLKKFVQLYTNDDTFKAELDSLIFVSKSKEWKTALKILWSVKNQMAMELLDSSKFTEGDVQSKDVTQRVYHNISEFIDFLAQPVTWINKKGRIQMKLQSLKGVKPEKEIKNG